MHAWIAPTLVVLLCACSAADETPPDLEVTAPERGTLQDGLTVTVRGTVADAVAVTVNGLAAEVGADGQFELSFAVAPGVDVIETIAVDDAGNEQRDVRAVLAGPLAATGGATGGWIDDALAAKLGPEAFAVLSEVVAARIAQLDLAALVGDDGPLVSVGSECFGADVTVRGVALGGVALGLVPGDGAIATAIGVDGLELRLRLDYRVGCVAHTADVLVHADRVSVGGALGLAITDDAMASSLAELQLELEGLDLTADGLPGEILDLVEAPIEALAPTVAEAIATDALPGLIDETLADLAGRAITVPVLGRSIDVSMTPTAVAIDPAGVRIALRGALHVSGDAGGRYLATPAAAPALEAGPIAVAISDDAINQLFAGMWASGALAHELELEHGNPLKLLVGEETTTLKLSLALPPTATADADGDLRLVIGDALVRCEDARGAEMATLALSIATTLGASADDDGHVALRLGDPQVWAQVLTRSDRLEHPLDGDDLVDLIDALYPIVATHANHTLETLPLPSFEGLRLVAPAVDSRDGFVVLHTGVSAAP